MGGGLKKRGRGLKIFSQKIPNIPAPKLAAGLHQSTLSPLLSHLDAGP
jgi:hypothetical protein